MPSSNPLPSKESTLFRKLLKCYEMKQYKNGLKLAKQILSNPKYAEHGETLAMKGLTLNGLGRRDEAYKYVRLGLRNDLKSHVCWHVYGLLQRSDKKYDEAIKCYRNALKCEKDNLQILKDLSLLQVQMRDLEGYKETRHQLFKLRPSQHASWIGYAMSYHLLGDFETANNILESFRQSQALVETHDYRHSELLLYQNIILEESGNYERALSHLKKFENEIVDKLAVNEKLGELNILVGSKNEAVPIYESLIKRNPENVQYYEKYFEAKEMTSEKEKLDSFKRFRELYPYALCPRRLPLNYATGDEFRTLIDEYLRRGLRKGIPPLFVTIRALYSDVEKLKIVENLINEYYENLKSSGHFSKADCDNNLPIEPASVLLWTMLFLSQHYDHLRQTDKALEFINLAIEHTPTLIELFVTKGRIYKHAGDPIEACKCLDEAQSLDTADRYINSKCAKYMLRADCIKEAGDICSKFTREGVSAMENLNEMQCMWFQTECALAFQRMGKWGEALKKCHEVERHFAEITEDQFDFHTYCMRKMTLRSYVGLLRLEDVLRQHPFYFKAAKCAIEVYIRLFDKPLKSEEIIEEIDTENLPPSELKKLRNKQRKAKRKAELESEQAAAAAIKKEQHQKSKQQNQETDPEAPQLDELIPEKLERPEDPLEKAIEFLKPLQLLANNNIETHLLGFEVYLRKNKILLMIQCIKRAVKINPEHPQLFSCYIKLAKCLQELPADLNPNIKAVVDKAKKELIGSNSTSIQIINDGLQKHANKSIEHILEGAKGLYSLDEKKKDEAIKLITSFDISKLSLIQAVNVYEALHSGAFGKCDEHLKSYKENCRKHFKYAQIFRDQTESNNLGNSVNVKDVVTKTADL